MEFRPSARSRWRAAVVAMLLAAVALTGCSGSTGPTRTAAGGTMVVRLGADWDHLDIQAFPSAQSYNLSYSLYDRLLALGPGGKLLPYVAESWTQTPTSVKFTLRSDPTCSDGAALTASAVANSMKRLFVTGVSMSRYLGSGPYSVSADDSARTLTINLGTPFSDAIFAFTQNAFGIVCPAGLADPNQLKQNAYGSGPFVVESAAHGDQLVLKARPEWKWGPYGLTATTPGFPQKLIYKVITNETTAANLLLTGGLDVALIQGPDAPRLLSNHGLNHQIVRPFTLAPLVFNESAGHPTSDEKVREAIMTAVDPKQYNQVANGGLGQNGTSLFSPDLPCYDPSTASLMPKPSAEQAKSILLSAGYTAGPDGKLQKDGKPLSVVLNFETTLGSAPELVASELTAAGITPVLQVTDFTAANANKRMGKFDVTAHQLVGFIPAPFNVAALFVGPPQPQGLNISRTNDPTLETNVKAAIESTGTERCRNWGLVQRRLLQAHHLLPLATIPFVWFSRGIDFTSVTGFVEPASLKRKA